MLIGIPALEKEGPDLDNDVDGPHCCGAFYLLVLCVGPTGAILKTKSNLNHYF
jgi:hypothetical protein